MDTSQSSSLPIPRPSQLQPIADIDQQTWHSNSNAGNIVRRRRRSGGDVTPRLVFAALRMLLEHICDSEICAKRIYRCLRKKLDKFFESESTPKYDVTLLLTQELDRVICDIARRENIDIHLDRCYTTRSLVVRSQADQPKRMSAHNFLQNYIVLGDLGQGGFGKVYRVRNKLDLREYALKEIPLRAGEKQSEMQENEKINREVVYLAQLDNPNIVRYFYAWLEFHPVLDVFQSIQRLASIEWPDSDESFSTVSPDSPLPCVLPPSLTIEEMSPRAANPPPFDLDNSALPNNRELNSDDFRRPDDTQWSSAWSNDDGDLAKISMPQNQDGLPLPTGTSRSNSDPGGCSKGKKIIPVRHSTTMMLGGAGDQLQLSKKFKPFLYIQMELCDQSLKEWLAERNCGPETDNAHYSSHVDGYKNGTVTDHYLCVNRRLCLNLFEQMTRGLKYIHSENMIHRDIKPANVLLIKKSCGSLLVKLADFGLSTLVKNRCCEAEDLDQKNPPLSADIGTRHYAAPEQRGGNSYDQKADIYSLGLILFELFQPYCTDMELMKLTEGLRQDPVVIDRQFSGRWPDVALWVRRLIHKSPECRPTAAELLNECPLLSTWQFLKTENDTLRNRVKFLEADKRRVEEANRRLEEENLRLKELLQNTS